MTSCLTHIDVAVALPVHNTYTYRVPDALLSLVAVGKRVLVPFKQRKATGYILGRCESVTAHTEQKKIKPIFDVLDEMPFFPENMIPFYKWIAAYYLHPIGEVIKCALPSGINLYDFVSVEIAEKGKISLTSCKPSPLETEILNHLRKGPCRLKHLRRQLKVDIPTACIHKMEESGWIKTLTELTGGETKPRMERYVALGRPIQPDEYLSLPRQKIIEAIAPEEKMPIGELKNRVPTATTLIKKMEKSGHIRIYHRSVYRDPFGDAIPPDSAPLLSTEQQEAVSSVLNALGKGFSTFLLAGVTGSGKTEVYMQIAEAALKRDVSVLVLVPEIALISQMERRFRARFGECVAIFHSGLSPGERYDQWIRILRKEVSIAIGARSAIFAPFSDLGLIIIDEEHDTSYKQEHQLGYNARDLAVVRAKLQKGIAVLGSATPSIQSYRNVRKQNFIELTLKNRVEKRPLPEITVVDLCHSRSRRGIRRFITPELSAAMEETLNRGEQVLIFLNRRGFASFPICSSCGEPIRCKNCDISLTLHQDIHAYKCHYCGFTKASVSHCAACGSSKIHLLGLGTEKVEQAVKLLFPKAHVARMDRDTTRRRGALLKILKELRNHTIDILVGTQMVAKGHDFPNITLVGIICADLSLNFPDFRAGERTFQLLAQVSGRAGRGTLPGRVILQTYNPDHFSIAAAKQQDFKTFYEKEIQFRKALNYPPFSRMILLKISGKDRRETERCARILGETAHSLRNGDKPFQTGMDVLGPIAAPVSRIAKQFRWQILLKGANAKTLHRFIQSLLFGNRSFMNKRGVKVVVDVDPVYMM